MLLEYFSSDCVCDINENMYNVVDFQLPILAQLEALSKKLVVSTLIPLNVNLVRVIRCDFYGEVHANGYCILYIEETHYTGDYQEPNHYFNTYNTRRVITQVLNGVTIKFKISTKTLLKIYCQGSRLFYKRI